MHPKLLEGVRILDMTMWWSGPMCTSYLGALGAEVIKVESVQSPDGFRYTMTVPGENWWELSPQFNGANMNKMGLTLNLSDPKGLELFKELIKKCDIVLENFSPRVMGNFGLSYEILSAINPEIIMMSMPAYGRKGPMKEQPGFAYTFEIMAGIAQLNGYPDGNPMIISGTGDVISASHAAFALMTALEAKEKTGKGQYIELTQMDAAACFMGAPIADLSLNNRSWERLGNRHPNMAPHGVYRSKGDDRWIAISIQNDAEWQMLCQIMGNGALAEDIRLRSLDGRQENHDEIDKHIENWTTQYDHYEASEILQQAGISAGPVLEVDEMEKDPFLQGMFQEVSRDLTGTHLFPSWPVKLSGERVAHHSPAPILGQHNRYVLKEILGLREEDILLLEESNIIGSTPLGVKA